MDGLGRQLGAVYRLNINTIQLVKFIWAILVENTDCPILTKILRDIFHVWTAIHTNSTRILGIVEWLIVWKMNTTWYVKY